MSKDEQTTALAERKASEMAGLRSMQIRTVQELATYIREVQGKAFILSPVPSPTAIGDSIAVHAQVVTIDPSVDAETGAGAEVYHQPSIHKRTKASGNWVPAEVSLNKYGLLRVLNGAGVNILSTHRVDDGTRANYWCFEVWGDVMEFDGFRRRLPPGIADVDLRDGSPAIGGWTPEEWKVREEAVAAKRAALPEDKRWTVKPESINGWTAERVMQQRRFGMRLAVTKATNSLIRNLGVLQKYTIDDLKVKPFVILRASFVPDTSDPEVRRMLTEAHLRASALMYPADRAETLTSRLENPMTHGHGDPTTTLNGHVIDQPEVIEPAEAMVTAKAPEDAVEVDLSTPEPKLPGFHITKVRQTGKGAEAQYFADTKEGPVLYTTDIAIARTLNAARVSGAGLEIETEKIAVRGATYRSVVTVEPAV